MAIGAAVRILWQVGILLLVAASCQGTREDYPGAKDSADMADHRYAKPTDGELKARLTPLEYAITQKGGTEPPFQNRYFDHHEEGIYVDVVSGQPLFSSRDKFDSGTGWPSFTRTIAPGAVRETTDSSHGMRRTEVRSSGADSHLGHVFEDGPAPTGRRYCINSAALRFVAKSKLAEQGYGEYLARFAGASAGTPAVADANACRVPTGGCQASVELAYLAGGCFWGMQQLLRQVPGVLETRVGYMGGTTQTPTYAQVRTGVTGHAETVRVAFDPARISYAELLERWFFRIHDPTTRNQQGNDRGTQYRSAIFYVSAVQEQEARRVVERVRESGRFRGEIVTELFSAGAFTEAEEEHQDYLVKHPGGYTCHYLRD